ncbi:MAG: class I SAM-dependent methyltransferase [Bacteroidota bacterium]
MAHEYPETFARFYDLIYHHLRDSADSGFYLGEIRNTKGRVLEIGTGTGRFFLNALKEGADIYGIDISFSMVDILQTKLDKKDLYRVSLQSIVDFNLNMEFDLIIAPFRVFMHLLEKDDQIKALNNVYRHLGPGGKFIFDVFVPNLSALINGISNQIDFDGEYEPGKKVRRIVSTSPDLHNQLINIDFLLEWDEGNETRHQHWLTPLRYFFRFELEHLVERSDFRNYKIFGDFQGNELNDKSVEFIVICSK